MMKNLLVVVVLFLLFSTSYSYSQNLNESDTGLDSFLSFYLKEVTEVIAKIDEHEMTNHDRFLVLSTYDNKYVQCLFHDEDMNIYCEATSGYYQSPKPEISSLQLMNIVKGGFYPYNDNGNYKFDYPVTGPETFEQIAKIMLETMYLSYDARIGEIKIYAPFVPEGTEHIPPYTN